MRLKHGLVYHASYCVEACTRLKHGLGYPASASNCNWSRGRFYMFGAGDLVGAEPCFINDQGQPYGNAMVELTCMDDFMRFVRERSQLV